MPTIFQIIEWDMGHRLVGHEGKCADLHGHRYRAEITIHNRTLDALGRVVDFGEVKKVIKGWIDENWDHRFMTHLEDPLRVCWEQAMGHLARVDPKQQPLPTPPDTWWATMISGIFRKEKPPVFCRLGNPTVENIAHLLGDQCVQLLPDLRICEVRVYETPNCGAVYQPRT